MATGARLTISPPFPATGSQDSQVAPVWLLRRPRIPLSTVCGPVPGSASPGASVQHELLTAQWLEAALLCISNELSIAREPNRAGID